MLSKIILTKEWICEMTQDFSIKTTDIRLDALSELLAGNPKYIFIWGNGEYSHTIEDYIKHVGHYDGEFIHVISDELLVDNDNAVPISQLVDAKMINEPLVFGFYNYPAILNIQDRYSSVFSHMYDFHFVVVNGRKLDWNPKLAKSRERDYEKTYRMLKDDSSRETMQLYLNAATAGEFSPLFDKCYVSKPYFNSLTSGLHVDTLVDCGAYDGDSIHDFISLFDDYTDIIAFEPDSANATKLAMRIKNEGISNVTILKKGVGSQYGILRFRANGTSNSSLDDSGDIEIEITTLDTIAPQLNGTVFIKMDIEGSELEALRGAETLIKNRHPILAVCVYHKEEDLIEIPQYINSIVGDGVYDYYLRFHGLDLAELVFYAIPVSIRND